MGWCELEWSPDALDDLDDIWDYIAMDSPDNASDFISEIQDKAEEVAKSDLTDKFGTPIPEIGDDRFRELHYKGYNIVYEIRQNAIRVHEVYNQKRIYIRSYKRQ